MRVKTMKVIPSKYKAVCKQCGGVIEVGDCVSPWNYGGSRDWWIHTGCAERNNNKGVFRNGHAPAPSRNTHDDDYDGAPDIFDDLPDSKPKRPSLPEEVVNGINQLSIKLEDVVKIVDERIASNLGTAAADLALDVNAKVDAKLNEMDGTIDSGLAGLRAALAEIIDERIKALPLVKTLEITSNGKKVKTIKGEVYHPQFDWIVKLAQARKNILLVGNTGSGKSHAGKQVADVLDLPFAAVSCSGGLTEAKLIGRVTPNINEGKACFEASEFVKLYETGGVFVLDELDGLDPNLTIVLNSALSNGWMGLPDRKDKPIATRHKDFILIATANTWGTGSSRRYVGRYPIDEATLDRFRIGQVEIGYNEEIENRLCGGDKVIFSTLQNWRKKIMEAGLERVLSTRFFKDTADMIAFGATWPQIERAFFAGWRKEEVVKVLGREVQ